MKKKRSLEELLAKKEEFLKDFRRFRYNYIEEFPKEKVMPPMPNYELYKCRTNFFSSIYLRIIFLQQLGLLTSVENKEEYAEFLRFCETLRGRKEFYKQEDVDRANKVLDCLIKELSS